MTTSASKPTVHFVTIDGKQVTVDGTTIDAAGSPHTAAVHHIARTYAQPLGQAVEAIASDSGGHMRLTINPDGSTGDVAPISETEARDLERTHRGTGLHVVTSDDDPAPTANPWVTTAAAGGRPAPATEVHVSPTAPRHARKSFISEGPVIQPAKQGWRGSLNRFGLRVGPGPAEKEWRQDVQLVSQHWPGPRTIAVANGKGGANKTPTTAMLSAVFARYGGAGVLAWDNNETRGTLAWRTQGSNHDNTVLDLLPRVDQLLGTGAQSAEMSYFAHHQPADKFDVLRSDQSVDGGHEVSADDVNKIHRVAARYYRMIVMDSGNNERAANWRAMIEHTDGLVVPCTNAEETAEAGARLLETLIERDEHNAALARNAVVILSQRTPGKDPNVERITANFEPLVREVVTIPYDKALQSGVIHFDALRPATQRAWLRAAAAVARGLSA